MYDVPLAVNENVAVMPVLDLDKVAEQAVSGKCVRGGVALSISKLPTVARGSCAAQCSYPARLSVKHR